MPSTAKKTCPVNQYSPRALPFPFWFLSWRRLLHEQLGGTRRSEVLLRLLPGVGRRFS
jgi:hypothetical protein